ncbi:MAG TPA: hypothetical protein ENL07_00660 [Chlorobaculum parvum]|uniref:Uncharacterized protein n=1 Tax=Chlorobaculum parvum TaxID=274539 RepID=A0A7C5DF94_9CHLB|nr:hypothetical protein [Chlorobaculum parvum]
MRYRLSEALPARSSTLSSKKSFSSWQHIFRWTNKTKPATSCNATPAGNVRFSRLKTRRTLHGAGFKKLDDKKKGIFYWKRSFKRFRNGESSGRGDRRSCDRLAKLIIAIWPISRRWLRVRA